ncbi:MAG: DUF362 domain-containing protein [candidate division Zixibacteria bacterium]|nr:DUF362 domain-containing protein [candidate division Zixibacteria bacterium]
MSKLYHLVTRRDFIKGTGFAAVGLAAGFPALAEEVSREIVNRSRVVLIRNRDVVTASGKIDGALVQQMLDEAMVALFGKDKAIDCWRQIIKPTDIVGIKSNVWQYLPTPPEVEQAIKTRVLEAGVARENVSIDDRNVLNNPVFQKATALINTRPMRTHGLSGVGGLIKNHIMFAANPPDYHDDACAPLAKLWELPQVKGKTRLNVLVMMTPQFHCLGVHHFDKAYVWSYNGLIVSVDPVAADSIGLKIIQQKRRLAFGEDRPLQPNAHHIAIADQEYHLGNSDSSKIDLIRLGWENDILI